MHLQDPEGRTEGLVPGNTPEQQKEKIRKKNSIHIFIPWLFPFQSYFHQGSAITWQLEHLASPCLGGEQPPKRQDNGAGRAASSAH